MRKFGMEKSKLVKLKIEREEMNGEIAWEHEKKRL